MTGYTLRKSEKTTNYSVEWKQPLRWKLVWHAKKILKMSLIILVEHYFKHEINHCVILPSFQIELVRK